MVSTHFLVLPCSRGLGTCTVWSLNCGADAAVAADDARGVNGGGGRGSSSSVNADASVGPPQPQPPPPAAGRSVIAPLPDRGASRARLNRFAGEKCKFFRSGGRGKKTTKNDKKTTKKKNKIKSRTKKTKKKNNAVLFRVVGPGDG